MNNQLEPVPMLKTVEQMSRLSGIGEDITLCKADPGHAFRVAEISRRIAEEAELKEPLVSNIGIAALFHDVGKVNIPEGLLFKPGKLTEHETEVMRTHTLHGHAILSKYHNEIMRLAASIALYHHERLDGSGYWGYRMTL